MSNASPAAPQGRIAQLRQAYQLTKKTDPRLGWILLATFLVSAGVVAAVELLLFGSHWLTLVIAIISALLFGFLAATFVFGRRAEKSMYIQAEGQPGAAAGALQMLRRGWFLKPAVGFNKNQDLVHRLVGRPGVVLVGEGASTPRVKALLAAEAKKHQRIVGEETPVVQVVIGSGDDAVPLPKLVKHVRKLPKSIKPAQVTEVMYKLKALDASRGTIPMPKGPVPTSMKGARKAMRG
jgi:uncharacterized integral membrane protein